LIAIEKIEQFGIYGNLIIVAGFLFTAIVALAGSFAVLCFASGVAYGFWIGTLTALCGAYLGAGIAFFLGRTLLRQYIAKRIKGNMIALDRMVKEKGLLTVILARLAIFPPNLLNYFFSVTSVSLFSYIVGSVIGLTPGILVLSILGATIHHCGCNEGGKWVKIAIYIALGITVILTVILTIWSRKAIRKYNEEESKKVGTPINSSSQESLQENQPLLVPTEVPSAII